MATSVFTNTKIKVILYTKKSFQKSQLWRVNTLKHKPLGGSEQCQAKTLTLLKPGLGWRRVWLLSDPWLRDSCPSADWPRST